MSISTSNDHVALATRLKDHALSLGFTVARIAPATPRSGLREQLGAWLDAGYHGTMHWMAETKERRANPSVLWYEARSILVVAANYGPQHDPLEALEDRKKGVISVYASGEDYHDVMKKRLKQLARWFVSETGNDVKVFVDTAPVMEKPLAELAGVGWQGKHTNLVSRDFGSWVFLGCMFTTASLPADDNEVDHCGSCRACLDICPTAAFPRPYQLDARRCLSYLTIENKGPIPAEFRKPMGNRIYGCDDCLAICPWNKFAKAGQEQKFAARQETSPTDLRELLGLDDASFRQRFRKNPVKRIGRDRFMRNVLIAVGNSGDVGFFDAARAHLVDPNPLVRGAAVWALGQLDPYRLEAEIGRDEPDKVVREEWNLALSQGSRP